jgi:hypothetical protein
MSQQEPLRPPRFCPNCGAHNLVSASTCGVCGQPLGQRDDLAQLWGTDKRTGASGETEIIDLYPTSNLSSQATTPFTQTRPFTPADVGSSRTATSAKQTTSADPWSAPAGKLAQTEAAPAAPAARPVDKAKEPKAKSQPRTRKGPPGFLLGCLSFLIITAVAIAIIWGAVHAAISNRIEDEVGVGITNELRTVDTVKIPESGQIVLTEQEINADLDSSGDSFSPLEDVRVSIDPASVQIRFNIYGVTSTYKSGLDVVDGQIVAVNPTLSKPASALVDIDDITAIFESEAGELLRRSGAEATDVQLRDGSLIIKTRPQPAT